MDGQGERSLSTEQLDAVLGFLGYGNPPGPCWFVGAVRIRPPVGNDVGEMVKAGRDRSLRNPHGLAPFLARTYVRPPDKRTSRAFQGPLRHASTTVGNPTSDLRMPERQRGRCTKGLCTSRPICRLSVRWCRSRRTSLAPGAEAISLSSCCKSRRATSRSFERRHDRRRVDQRP